MTNAHDLGAIARQFEMDGSFLSAIPYGSGHINDSYCITFSQGGAPIRYILQRINHHIFRNPAALMENIERVTAHVAAKEENDPDFSRRALSLIPAREGRTWHVDAQVNYWRAYRFIEGARTYDAVESAEQAFQTGKAFGRFQQQLADLPAPRLHDTIPNFHNAPERLLAFEQATSADVARRATSAKPEIAFALENRSITTGLMNAGLPERVTHNDTKINNVMLDDSTGEGICVIDLDTVMPGLAPYDFGDMVRTTTTTASEDERDLSQVSMQFPLFEALLRGYIAGAASFLTSEEKQSLAFSGISITFEIGLRFLTDYLSGDTYFKVHREGHNLDRCRAQFKLVESMQQQERAMERLIHSLD
jgi:Ser/Thr protein kinase RdoA (MazF antagonist)